MEATKACLASILDQKGESTGPPWIRLKYMHAQEWGLGRMGQARLQHLPAQMSLVWGRFVGVLWGHPN